MHKKNFGSRTLRIKSVKNKIIALALVFSSALSNLNIATYKNTIPESYKTTHNNQSVNKKVAFGSIFAARVIAGGGIVAAIFGGKKIANQKTACLPPPTRLVTKAPQNPPDTG